MGVSALRGRFDGLFSRSALEDRQVVTRRGSGIVSVKLVTGVVNDLEVGVDCSFLLVKTLDCVGKPRKSARKSARDFARDFVRAPSWGDH